MLFAQYRLALSAIKINYGCLGMFWIEGGFARPKLESIRIQGLILVLTDDMLGR